MLSLVHTSVRALEDGPEKRIYHAVQLGTQTPVIDGRLDDSCWRIGEWGGNFIQWLPHENGTPSQKTEFKILYDEKYLYCAIRAYDSEPEKMRRLRTRRDTYGGEGAGFIFDSYFDHRTAYEFAMTAAGTRIDLSHLDDGNSWKWDRTWDAVWQGKTALEDSAWTAEMRVPFSQLRFGDREEHIWGLNIWRSIYRLNEEDHWQYIPRSALGGVRYFGELHGIRNIANPRRIELLPYTRGKFEAFRKEPGNPFATGRRAGAVLGLDGKIGLKSNLTIDFTVNPDFGQVEADPSVVNLTAFETFFEEKRPFFMEGKQSIMNFQIGGDMLYYSRRLGKRPGFRPAPDAAGYVKLPETTTILGAYKFTGKTDKGLSFGVLHGVTATESASLYSNGTRHSISVEPLSSYFVGRIQQEYRQGSTVIGGMMTATNRHVSADHLRIMHDAAYSGGLNFSNQWGQKRYYLNLHTIFSRVRGDRQAILSTQRAAPHYYQRPDASHLRYDSTRTALAGHGGRLEVGRGGTGRWRLSESVTWLAPGLELNDIGYLKQADFIGQTTRLGYNSIRPYSILRSYSASVVQSNHWNFGRERLRSGIGLNSEMLFQNHYGMGLSAGRESEVLDTRATRGGPALKYPGSWYLHWSVRSDRRKPVSLSLRGRHAWPRDDISTYYRMQPGVLVRFSDAFNVSADVAWSYNHDNLQYVRTGTIEGVQQYIFARIRQKTLSETFRVHYSLTPDLSIQYYGQPFISAGRYAGFKKITVPRAPVYTNRFQVYTDDEIAYESKSNKYVLDGNRDGIADYTFKNPDFNVREFRSNLVFRWEYTPGSTVFVVWTQSRESRVADGRFSFRHDFRELFDIHPYNIFLVKFNHWFSL